MNEPLNIISLQIDPVEFPQAIEKVKNLALNRLPSFVCFANVHMIIESHLHKSFAKRVNTANLVLPDGQPVAKLCKLLYNKDQERIAGMDFMPRLLDSINQEEGEGFKVFLYGSEQRVLETLQCNLVEKYKSIRIVGAISPPFRTLTTEEQDGYLDQINRSSANIIFVSLGCPEQEKWMFEHHKKINAVMLGVGGAFKVLAGLQLRAPKWMQQTSLEWFYRLIQEPRRLFKRYLVTNSLFLWLMGKELIKSKLWTSNARVSNPVGQAMKN